MKSILTLSVLFISILSTNAQITIDSADLGSIGDQLIIATDTSVSGKTISPASNVTQIFDYTSLSVSSTGNIDFLAPAGIPGASNFPNSNIAIFTGNQYIYGIKSNTDFNIDGLYGNLFGAGVVGALDFDPNRLLMPFPLDYSDTYLSGSLTDTIVEDTITGIFDSLRLKSNTQIVSLVDAFGTLNLPTISESVLRKYDVEVTTDSLWGQAFGIWQSVQQTSTTRYYYRFIAKNKSYYILEAEADAAGNVLRADYQTGGALVAGIVENIPVSCYGGSDGELKASSVGGTTPYTYAWSNGQSTISITSLTATTYTVTVTDQVGATYTAQADVTQPDSIPIVSTQIGPDHGLTDGFIFISASGGAPSYSYVWSNGEVTQNIDSLSHGTYTVTVTDNNGCTNSKSFDVGNLTSIKDLGEVSEISIFPNPTKGQITIQTSKVWSLEIYNLLGKRVKSINGIGESKVDLSNLNSGVYFMLVTIDEQIYRQNIELIE
jgi:hypothetical protein